MVAWVWVNIAPWLHAVVSTSVSVCIFDAVTTWDHSHLSCGIIDNQGSLRPQTRCLLRSSEQWGIRIIGRHCDAVTRDMNNRPTDRLNCCELLEELPLAIMVVVVPVQDQTLAAMLGHWCLVWGWWARLWWMNGNVLKQSNNLPLSPQSSVYILYLLNSDNYKLAKEIVIHHHNKKRKEGQKTKQSEKWELTSDLSGSHQQT